MKWEIKNNWKYSKFEKILVLKVYYEEFFFNKNYFLSVDLHNTSYKGGGEVWASKIHTHITCLIEKEKKVACKHTLPTHEQGKKHKYIVWMSQKLDTCNLSSILKIHKHMGIIWNIRI